MSLFHEQNEDEEEEFTSKTQTISVTLPAWLIIAIDEKLKLAKRSTVIADDLAKLPKYSKEKRRILKEMYVGTKPKPAGTGNYPVGVTS